MPIVTTIEDLRRMHRRRAPRMFYDYAIPGPGRGHLQGQRGGLPGGEAAPAGGGEHRQAVARDDHDRPKGRDAGGAFPLSAWWACSTPMARSLRPRRREVRCAVHALHHEHLLDRGHRGEHLRPVLVPALCDARPRFLGPPDRPAKAAGCDALVVTLDLQVLGQRHKDIRNGLSAPPKLTIPNIVKHDDQARLVHGDARHEAARVPEQSSPCEGRREHGLALGLDGAAVRPDVELGRPEVDQGPLGRQDHPQGHPRRRGCGARREVGADAIIVSNHGGRQLDGAPSAIAALPAIADAVGAKTEVWMDSGIRSGQDVLKAVALGAKATMIGRAFVYGVGAMGEEGVSKALEIIRKELDLTMGFCGRTDIRGVDAGILLDPTITAGDAVHAGADVLPRGDSDHESVGSGGRASAAHAIEPPVFRRIPGREAALIHPCGSGPGPGHRGTCGAGAVRPGPAGAAERIVRPAAAASASAAARSGWRTGAAGAPSRPACGPAALRRPPPRQSPHLHAGLRSPTPRRPCSATAASCSRAAGTRPARQRGQHPRSARDRRRPEEDGDIQAAIRRFQMRHGSARRASPPARPSPR